jgi:hypothetical protein
LQVKSWFQICGKSYAMLAMFHQPSTTGEKRTVSGSLSLKLLIGIVLEWLLLRSQPLGDTGFARLYQDFVPLEG